MLNSAAEPNRYLELALAEAARARGSASPNPAVGALLVKNGKVISTGYHRGAGHPHAEVEAVDASEGNSKGATLYVTLEPCCHWGRTPPCTKLIQEAGIKEVYYAYRDPDPRVGGRGAAELAAGGTPCLQVSLPQVDAFYEAYGWWKRTGRPFVTAKLALSLDGRIAGAGGIQVAITAEPLGIFTHEHRKRADAILTTARTVLADNPRLDARTSETAEPKPVYVLDRRGALTSDRKIFSTAKEVITLTGDIESALERIGRDGRYELWVEAGGTLFTELFRRRLMNRAFLYVGAKILGSSALPAFQEPLELAAAARRMEWRIVGPDALLEVEF